MKKIFLMLFLLMAIYNSSYSQFTTAYEAWRVVYVSPNYTNVYPRYSTLQQVWNAIKDSASVSTSKYFIVNAVTNFNNITDWSSSYKDSLLNRSPYITLVQFGNGIEDTITGVDPNHFDLIASILYLNDATAKNGLSFDDGYIVNTKAPILIVNDSLYLALSAPLYFTPNTVGLKRFTHSGLQVHPDSLAIRILTQLPLKVNGDTLKLPLSYYFTGAMDSLGIDWNTQQFDLIYGSSPAVNLKLDSGLATGVGGLKTNVDNVTIKLNSNKKLYVDYGGMLGNGLDFTGDSVKLLIAYYTVNNDRTDNILTWSGDSLQFNYFSGHFQQDGNGLNLNLDSGLTYGNGVQLYVDYGEFTFDAGGQLKTATTLWGDGLYKSGDSGNVRVNEFGKVENDTVKIKTSYTLEFYGDSLTTNVTGAGRGILPFDTTGVPILYTGKIKRITYTYQLSSGNDTVITTSNNQSVTIGDKIRGVWVNGSSEFRIQKWSQGTRSWSNAIGLSFTDFANRPYRIIVELYSEAQ